MMLGRTDLTCIVKGLPNPHGWTTLATVSKQLRPPAPAGEVLGVLWHLSDLHICDAESPARLEYLDRYSDEDSPYADFLGDVGTYRPQEILTVQVAVTMTETVNRYRHGPMTGSGVDLALLTGDLIDNAQRNELQWYQSIVCGGDVAAASGDPAQSSWVGSRHAAWDERYWHPDGSRSGRILDRPTRVHGFPVIPGLVEAAREQVHSPGLRVPWISVYGNHDGLLQGTVAPSASLGNLAVGAERITGLAPGTDPRETAWAIARHGPAHYVHTDRSPREHVTADSARRLLTEHDFVLGTGNTATYFAMDVAELRIICLNTVNPYGGWEGSLDAEQFRWLTSELQSTSRPVVIASHHPSATLTNAYAPLQAQPRVLGEQVLDLLHGFPQVVLWLAGHVHYHSMTRHVRGDHHFLEITTASMIDWPQQGRIIEILRTPATQGHRPQIVVVSTAMDHQAPIDPDLTSLRDHHNLASVSRLLSANDYHTHSAHSRMDAVNGWWEVPTA